MKQKNKCCECSWIFTSSCDVYYWSPTAPLYANKCKKRLEYEKEQASGDKKS